MSAMAISPETRFNKFDFLMSSQITKYTPRPGLASEWSIVDHARQKISDAADRPDTLDAARIGAGFSAEVADVHVNAAVERVEAPAVDLKRKLFARDNRPCRTRQQC